MTMSLSTPTDAKIIETPRGNIRVGEVVETRYRGELGECVREYVIDVQGAKFLVGEDECR